MMPSTEEEYFTGAISNYTANDINEMIDWNVDLASLIRKKYGGWISVARVYARKMRKMNRDTPITAANIMLWLQARRSDLWVAIKNNPNGTKWLEKQIEPIKQLLGLS